nr:retrovirus-related Pol polyprotein from transposon TNT 1-94 [Tanacetum cinerariifolium]
MTKNRSQLINFVSKFLGTVRFGNDHITKKIGYENYQMGKVTIARVYYVEGLCHNLFFVGQFYDLDLEVAFRKHTYFIRDMKGVDLLKGSRGSNLYTLSLENLMLSSHVKFLRSKDEVPDFMIKFLKMIQVRMNATVHNINTDNGTEFVNQTLRAYFEEFRSSHQTFVACTSQQNDVVERRNHTLVEAARTMLIFLKALLFLWAKAVVIACYTKNRSLILKHHNKTPYELLHDRKADLSYLYVFGVLYYPTNDGEDLGKLKPKADIGIFVGYAPAKKAFKIYNKRTRMIIETMHVDFHELTAMASKQFSSGPRPKLLNLGPISS